MDGQLNRQTDGQIDVQMNCRMIGWSDAQMDRLTARWSVERMVGKDSRMDARSDDGWVDTTRTHTFLDFT